MFYEYALDPAVLSSWQSVRYFLDAFAPWKGRFLAAFPKKWRRMVYENVRRSDAKDKEKLQIVERLQQLDRRVFSVRAGAAFDHGRTWLDNAMAEHGRSPFRAIITDEHQGEPFILDAEQVDERQALWKVENGCLLARNPLEVARALHLLLAVSSRVLVIDPFFRGHHDDKAETVSALCRAAGSASIEVHARLNDNDPGYNWLITEAERKLPRHLPVGMHVTLHSWRERPGGRRLHNRYVLTDIGGVKFGDSLERGGDEQQDHVSILDESSRADLWQQYCERPEFDAAGVPHVFIGRGASTPRSREA